MRSRGPNCNIELSPDVSAMILSRWLGRNTTCLGCERLHGGACYAVFALRFDRPPYRAVMKVDAEPDSGGFRRERRRIEYVKNCSPFPTPSVYFADDSRNVLPYSILLLEELAGVNLKQARLTPPAQVTVDRELAEALLELHSHRRATFGEIDETGQTDWRAVFLPRLIDLRQDMETRLSKAVLSDIDAALAIAPATMADSVAPTLVHGDLWSGNILVRQAEDGWHLSGVVDWPALQYADVEYELAYLEAWNTVTPAFFRAYSERNHPRDGYETRRLFYWLHTYMLHVWLFEEDRYRQLVAQTAKRIAQNA